MRTKELRQKRAAIHENTIKPIFAKAQAENRALDSAELETINRAESDMDALKATYEAEERAARTEQELSASISEPHRPEVRNERAVTETRTQRVAGEAYRDAFMSYLAGGYECLAPEQRSVLNEFRFQPEVRAQSVGTNSAGGYVVPTGFRALLVEAMKEFGGMFEVGATVLNTDSGNPLPIPTVNDTTITGELVAENTAVTAQDLTFSNVTLNAYKYSSKSVLVSFELLNDSAIAIEPYIAKALGVRLARILNTHFTTGTGSSQPQGIITGATSGKTAASATAITYSEIIDLIHSVDRAHRNQKARFMFNDVVLKALRQLLDSQGRPLWQPSLVPGAPDTFAGYQYVINQDMASAISTGAKTVAFGDFSYFHIRNVMDVQLFRITDKYIEQGSAGFLSYMRSDAKLVNPGSNPVKFLTQA